MDIPRYRIGNDLTVLWAICNNDGTPFDLSGKGVRLFVTNDRGMTEVVPTITTDKNGSITNVILWTFLGNNQKVLGKHTLTVEIVTADDKRVIKRDISDAFNLVARSEGEESGGEANAVDSGTIYLSTKLDVYRFGNARVEIGTNGNWFIDGYDTGRTALAGEPGIVHNIYTESDLGKEFDPDSKIDTFNAHAINAINNTLKRMTLEQLQDLSLADLEEYDVLAYNGNAWLNVPFRDLLNIFKGPSESSSGIGDGFWYLNEQDGKIHTDIGIVVHGDAIFEGDISSEGDGEDVVVGIQGVRVNGTTHYDEDGDGVVDLGTIESGGGGLTSVSWGDIQGTPPSVSTFDNDVPYVTDEELKPLGEEIELLSSMWHLDENGNLVTDKQVLIKNNLIIEGDTSSDGEGKDTPSGGISGVKVNGVTYYDDNGDGVIDLGTISGGGGTADLSNYYTKAQSDARYLALSGGTISGSGYWSLKVKSTGQNAAGIGFEGADGRNGYLLYTGGSDYKVTDNGWNNLYTLIHSGNIGSYAFVPRSEIVNNTDADTLLTNGVYLNATGNGSGNTNFPSTYSTFLTFTLSERRSAQISVGNNAIHMRRKIDTWSHWMRIVAENENGNVLIGTTTDDTSHKVQVDGALKVYETSQRRLYTRINSAGVQLGVNTSLYTGGWNGGVTVGADNSSIGFVAGAYLEGGTLLKLFYGGTSQANASIVIDGLGGNVGIGKTSPAEKLDVNGNIQVGASMLLYSGTSNPYIRFKLNGNIWYCQAYTTNGTDGIFLGSTSSKSLKVDASGNVYCPQNLVVSGDVASA